MTRGDEARPAPFRKEMLERGLQTIDERRGSGEGFIADRLPPDKNWGSNTRRVGRRFKTHKAGLVRH